MKWYNYITQRASNSKFYFDIHNGFIFSFPQPDSVRIRADDDGDDTDDECISPFTLPSNTNYSIASATYNHTATTATHADAEVAYTHADTNTDTEDATATVDDLLNDPIVIR